MSLGVLGQKAPQRSSRPSSAKPRNNINPITGEDVTEYESRQPHVSQRPEAVPSLDLGALSSRDDNRAPVGQYSHRLDTPGTASTVSWGTPQHTGRSVVSVYSEQNSARPVSQRPAGVPALGISKTKPTEPKPKPKQPTAWDADPVPEDLPGPDPHHQQQYKQYQQEIQNSYRAKQAPYSDQDIDQDIAELKSTLTARDEDTDTLYSQLSKAVRLDPSMDANLKRRLDAEALKEEKRKQDLIETVMVDQLSRPPISDVEQNSGRPVSRCHEPGMPRGTIRTLHETKIKTSSSATENLLSKRVRFGLRILSTNGHDAVRELMGFFFVVDNTFTVYEYRQFGKSAKALPFFARGSHRHCRGRLRGQEVTLRDIYPGATVVMSTRGQSTLPDTVSQRPVVTFIITDVDQDMKEQQLLTNTRGSELSHRRKELNLPADTQQLQDYMALQNLQDTVRDKLRKRGSRAVSSVGSYFRSMDSNKDGGVDKTEFRIAMKNCRIPIPEENMDGVWAILDVDGDGSLDYCEIMRGILGAMSEYRKSYVLKAFRKIDSKKLGVITHTDIRMFYCGNKHSSAAMETDGAELKQFLQSFDFCATRGEVTYHEFEEYYEGVSLMANDDDQFVNILRKTWGI